MRCRAKSGLWSSLGGLSPGFLHCPGPDSNCAADLGFHYGILIDSTRHSGKRHGPGSLGCAGCCHGAARLMSDVRGPWWPGAGWGRGPLFLRTRPHWRRLGTAPSCPPGGRRAPEAAGPAASSGRGHADPGEANVRPATSARPPRRPGASFPATCRWQRTTLGMKYEPRHGGSLGLAPVWREKQGARGRANGPSAAVGLPIYGNLVGHTSFTYRHERVTRRASLGTCTVPR